MMQSDGHNVDVDFHRFALSERPIPRRRLLRTSAWLNFSIDPLLQTRLEKKLRKPTWLYWIVAGLTGLHWALGSRYVSPGSAFFISSIQTSHNSAKETLMRLAFITEPHEIWLEERLGVSSSMGLVVLFSLAVLKKNSIQLGKEVTRRSRNRL